MSRVLRDLEICVRQTRFAILFIFLFRHEVPVSEEDIRIIHMDDDMVVVNKPASIPVSNVLDNRLTNKNKHINKGITHF
jgi:23S rRNA-/tRNA-specific pseudouridylate synthase